MIDISADKPYTSATNIENNNSCISTSKPKDLIIDCDPGCDDALAIFLAVRSRESPYNKIYITTVAGNVPVERTTNNARKIAGVAQHGLTNGPEITVHKGSAVSYMGKAPNVTSVHGRDGLGEVPNKIYPQAKGGSVKIGKESAVDILMGKFKKTNDKKYDLVCIGPLTNLATALSLSKEPEKLLDKFDRIVIMGGAFNHRGNITPTAEFNFFFDPVAVQILLDAIKKDEENLSKKIVFVPLNITERVQLNIKQENIEIEKEAGKDNPVGQWTLCMLQKYFDFHALSANELKENCAQNSCKHTLVSTCETTGKTYEEIRSEIKDANMIGKSGNSLMPRFCYLHDPLAIWYAMNQDDVKLEDASIKIHTDNDEMRGTIIVFDKKDSKPYSKGVKVKYLDPAKVTTDYVKGFKDNLLEACGLKRKDSQVVTPAT